MLTTRIARGSSGGPACWQGRGAASARRPGLGAARALPATLHSPARGSSNSEAAKALCTANARSPDHRASHADCAAGRMGAGAEDALWRKSRRSHVAASAANRPPTSTPTTPSENQSYRSRPVVFFPPAFFILFPPACTHRQKGANEASRSTGRQAGQYRVRPTVVRKDLMGLPRNILAAGLACKRVLEEGAGVCSR